MYFNVFHVCHIHIIKLCIFWVVIPVIPPYDICLTIPNNNGRKEDDWVIQLKWSGWKKGVSTPPTFFLLLFFFLPKNLHSIFLGVRMRCDRRKVTRPAWTCVRDCEGWAFGLFVLNLWMVWILGNAVYPGVVF